MADVQLQVSITPNANLPLVSSN